MEFSAQRDIEAPIEFVFERATDFASFERAIMRRGGDVERIAGDNAAVVGTKWNVGFRLRGKHRSVKAEVTGLDAPNSMKLVLTSSNLKGSTIVELKAVAPTRTHLTITVEAAAKSIAAKVLFQSLRFARGRTQSRFDDMLKGFAEDTEARYRS